MCYITLQEKLQKNLQKCLNLISKTIVSIYSFGLTNLLREKALWKNDFEYEDVTKYGSTRSLSLERCINRELKNYTGLKSYLLSEGLNDKRFCRLSESFNDPMTEVYLLFLQSVTTLFTNFNQFPQKEEPLVYLLHEVMQKFMNRLASWFVKPEVIEQLNEEKKYFLALSMSRENTRDDQNIQSSLLTKSLLKKLLEEDIGDRKAGVFFDSARELYETAYKYCIKWLPLDDGFYKNCTFADFAKHQSIDFEQIV